MSRRSVVLVAVLAGLSVVAAAALWWPLHCGGQPIRARIRAVPTVGVSAPNAEGVVTWVRPVLARLADGDPWIFALHWELPVATNAAEAARFRGRVFSELEVARSLEITLTDPQGRETVLRPEISPEDMERWRAREYHFEYWQLNREPTLFVRIHASGMETVRPDNPLIEGITAPWANQVVFDGGAPGRYTVRVAGSLVTSAFNTTKRAREPAGTHAFSCGEVTVERVEQGLRSIAAMQVAAADAVKAERPEDKRRGGPVSFDDIVGRRIVRFTVNTGAWTHRQIDVEMLDNGRAHRVERKDVDRCIAAGTAVEGEGGPIAVERVRAGDRLWGYDIERRRSVLVSVLAVQSALAGEVLEIRGALRLTPDHPILTEQGWKPAGAVLPDDRILDAAGALVRAGEATPLRGGFEVFDIMVDAPHTFFAGGVLVHNKELFFFEPSVFDAWHRRWPSPKPH